MASTTNTQARKGEWTMNGKWPPGPYIMTVLRCRSLVSFKTRDPGLELLLGLKGTNVVLHWYLVDSEKARWAWEDFAEDLIPEAMLGRTFVVIVDHGPGPNGGMKNRVKAVIAEVIDGES